ncbi:MAG: YfhO family protein, partial [Ignavibacteria bacterium]|nr:YfhO family protein [Ignavibacteria bacterium]
DSIYWYMSLNMNLIYNFSDVKSYDSTYQPSLNDLYKIFPEIYVSPQIWHITKPELIDFLSVKYAVVTKIEELPHQNFEMIGKYRDFYVYKNNSYRPIIQNGTETISYDQIAQPFNLYSHNLIISKNEELSIIKEYLMEQSIISIENVNLYQNMLIGTINTSSPTFLVSSIAFDKGWRVYINNQEVRTFSVNGGFLGFPTKTGFQDVKLYFVPVGFKEGVIVSGLSILIYIFYFIYYKLFNNVTIKRG